MNKNLKLGPKSPVKNNQNLRMRTTTKKDIIALFHHFIDTSDRILILTSPVTFRHNQFDIFKRFNSNLSHPQLRDVGRKTGIYKMIKQYVDLKPRDFKTTIKICMNIFMIDSFLQMIISKQIIKSRNTSNKLKNSATLLWLKIYQLILSVLFLSKI